MTQIDALHPQNRCQARKKAIAKGSWVETFQELTQLAKNNF